MINTQYPAIFRKQTKGYFVEFPDLSGCITEGETLEESILMASGIKPINNVVDISNFVMLETGQPIHMYDYDKLQEKKFTIKTGMDLTTTLLDGQEYKIIPSDLIVSTDGKVGCIAGVMGDDSTKIDENTTNIVIEVATFNGACLRATAKRLNLLTDASSRFIKNALELMSYICIPRRMDSEFFIYPAPWKMDVFGTEVIWT